MVAGSKKWIAVGALTLLCGVGVASQVHAGPWHGHRARTAEEMQSFMERRVDHLLDAVDADDAQREKVETIVAQRAPQMFALMQEGRALRQEIKNALLAERMDHAKLDASKQKLGALTERMADLGVDGLTSVAEVLTPAQRKLIADKLTQHLHE